MGVLTEAIQRELGHDTVPQLDPSGNTSIGTSVLEVLPNDPNRLSFAMVNLGAVAIYVKPARNVSATSGIRLAANGGSLTMTYKDDFHLVGWEWYAIADAAATAIMVLAVSAR